MKIGAYARILRPGATNRSGLEEIRLSPHPELQALSGSVLLERLRPLPHSSIERGAICEILVARYSGLVQSCVRPYRNSPEPPKT